MERKRGGKSRVRAPLRFPKILRTVVCIVEYMRVPGAPSVVRGMN
jgi:hypothetical protein